MNIIDTNSDLSSFQSRTEVGGESYTYPLGLNFTPGSPLHASVMQKIMSRVKHSKEVMSVRYPKFDQTDKSLQAYRVKKGSKASKCLDLSEDTNEYEGPDLNVIVPITTATLETILTYQLESHANGPFFLYRGVGPEDRVNAMLAELAIDVQTQKAKTLLSLHTQWRDGNAYGLGVVHCRWEKEMGKVVKRKPIQVALDSLGQMVTVGHYKATEKKVIFEGSILENIHPKRYFPDPYVSVHEVQRGEFTSFLSRSNYLKLAEYEALEPESWFNVKYLKGKNCISTLSSESYAAPLSKFEDHNISDCAPIDLVYCYIRLIPKDWKLGSSRAPEKWLFCIAGDHTIVRAQPINLNHNRFPIAVYAPTFDGYSPAPVSLLESVQGLQSVIDWYYRSHVHNVSQALNNNLVLDPSLANYKDAANRKPGKIIRIKEEAWGRGVENAVKQLTVTDVTRGHLSDVGVSIELYQRVTGAVDSIQGIPRAGGERRSATEMRDTRMSALSRLQKAARLGSVMSMADLGLFHLSHLQQFQSQPVYLELLGRNQQELQMIYEGNMALADPLDFAAEIDVMPADATSPGGEFLADMVNIYQLIRSDPQAAMMFDSTRIILDMYRRANVKNVEAFLKNPQQIQQQLKIVNDQQMQQALSEAGEGDMEPVNTGYPLENGTNAPR
jgi:hypothetical protein